MAGVRGEFESARTRKEQKTEKRRVKGHGEYIHGDGAMSKREPAELALPSSQHPGSWAEICRPASTMLGGPPD